MTEQIQIQLSKKFNKPTYSADIKLRDICSQLTLLLYGTTLTTGANGCLGQASQILVKHHNLKGKSIRVHVPQSVWDGAKQAPTKHSTWQGKKVFHKYGELNRYLENVIRHGKRHGLDVELVID